jgi:hypothetical protein
MFNDQFRLHILCEGVGDAWHFLSEASNGYKQWDTGLLISQKKDFVAKAMPYIQMTLAVMKLGVAAGRAFGLPMPSMPSACDSVSVDMLAAEGSVIGNLGDVFDEIGPSAKSDDSRDSAAVQKVVGIALQALLGMIQSVLPEVDVSGDAMCGLQRTVGPDGISRWLCSSCAKGSPPPVCEPIVESGGKAQEFAPISTTQASHNSQTETRSARKQISMVSNARSI